MARGAGVAAIGRQAAAHWPFPVLVQVEGGRSIYVDLRSSIGRGLFATGTFDIEAIKPGLEALKPGATQASPGVDPPLTCRTHTEAPGRGMVCAWTPVGSPW